MALLEFNRSASDREVRQFALWWLSGFCFLAAGLVYYRYGARPASVALVLVGGTSIVLGLVRPRWMRLVFLGWMAAAYPVGWVVSQALMVVMYFGVVTPIGLAMRLVGRDPLSRQFDRGATTYWTARQEPTDSASYFRQF